MRESIALRVGQVKMMMTSFWVPDTNIARQVDDQNMCVHTRRPTDRLANSVQRGP